MSNLKNSNKIQTDTVNKNDKLKLADFMNKIKNYEFKFIKIEEHDDEKQIIVVDDRDAIIHLNNVDYFIKKIVHYDFDFSNLDPLYSKDEDPYSEEYQPFEFTNYKSMIGTIHTWRRFHIETINELYQLFTLKNPSMINFKWNFCGTNDETIINYTVGSIMTTRTLNEVGYLEASKISIQDKIQYENSDFWIGLSAMQMSHVGSKKGGIVYCLRYDKTICVCGVNICNACGPCSPKINNSIVLSDALAVKLGADIKDTITIVRLKKLI